MGKKNKLKKEPIIGIDISYYNWLKANRTIFDEIDDLPKRLDAYIKKLDLLLTDSEYNELKEKTIVVLRKRYLEGIKRRIEQAIENEKPSELNITIERLYKEFDKLLCSADSRFEKVIKQVKRSRGERKKYQLVKTEIEKLEKEKTNKNKSKDELFHLAAANLGSTYETVKRLYYYKNKQ